MNGLKTILRRYYDGEASVEETREAVAMYMFEMPYGPALAEFLMELTKATGADK